MPHLAPSDIHVIFDSADKLRDSDAYKVVITSYDMLRRLSCKRCCEQEDPSAPASADGTHRKCAAESCIVSRQLRVEDDYRRRKPQAGDVRDGH